MLPPINLQASIPTPSPSPTPNPSDLRKHCNPNTPQCPKIGPNVVPGNTQQDTNAKPAISYCNGRLYVAWAGIDTSNTLNIGWGSTGNTFSNKVTFYGQSALGGNGSYTGPALACFYNPTFGTQLYIAWTGSDSNHKLNIGWFDGNPNDPYILQETQINTNGNYQTSNYSPSLTIYGSNLFLGWSGKGNGYLNFARSYNGISWVNTNTWYTQTSTGGIGIARYCPALANCTVWLSWIGTNSTHNLNTGYYNFNSGQFVFVRSLNFTSGNGNDASLFVRDPDLYFPYTDGLGDLVVAQSPNGTLWGNDNTYYSSLNGASGAVDGSNNIWLTWQEGIPTYTLLNLSKYP